MLGTVIDDFIGSVYEFKNHRSKTSTHPFTRNPDIQMTRFALWLMPIPWFEAKAQRPHSSNGTADMLKTADGEKALLNGSWTTTLKHSEGDNSARAVALAIF